MCIVSTFLRSRNVKGRQVMKFLSTALACRAKGKINAYVNFISKIKQD
jgi:hypothetical protein